jgi:hypothetical protein
MHVTMVDTTCQVKPSRVDEKTNRRTAEQGTAEYRSEKHFPGTKSQVSGFSVQVSASMDIFPDT